MPVRRDAEPEDQIYQRGYCQRRIDPNPYGSPRVDGLSETTFGREGRPRSSDLSDCDESREGEVGTDLRVPALRGEIVDVDDFISLDTAWAGDDANPLYDAPYGWTDREMGGEGRAATTRRMAVEISARALE